MQPNHVHIYVEHDDAAHSSNVGTSANGRAASQGGSHWSSAGGAQGMEPANVLGAGGHMNFANEHMKVYTVPRSLQMEVSCSSPEPSQHMHSQHRLGPMHSYQHLDILHI